MVLINIPDLDGEDGILVVCSYLHNNLQTNYLYWRVIDTNRDLKI